MQYIEKHLILNHIVLNLSSEILAKNKRFGQDKKKWFEMTLSLCDISIVIIRIVSVEYM